MPDNSFDSQIKQAQHAAKIREERLIREKTGLSESQIRRGGLVDFFRDKLRDFGTRTPHRRTPHTPPEVKRITREFKPKEFRNANGDGGAPSVGGGAVAFAVNHAGTIEFVSVQRA